MGNKLFNNKLKKVAERKENIEKWVNDPERNFQAEVDEEIHSAIENKKNFSDVRTSRLLEKAASYFLKSKDIDSGRSVEDSFYEDERDYRSHYEIGKNTVAVDDFVMLVDNGELSDSYLYRLFDVQKYQKADLRRLIMYGCNYLEQSSGALYRHLSAFVDDLYGVATPAEIRVLNLLTHGYNQTEIAAAEGVARSSIIERIDHMGNKLKKI